MKKDISESTERLRAYLQRMEERRGQDEGNNQRAYQEARKLSAWLSLYEHGCSWAKEQAEEVLRNW